MCEKLCLYLNLHWGLLLLLLIVAIEKFEGISDLFSQSSRMPHAFFLPTDAIDTHPN